MNFEIKEILNNINYKYKDWYVQDIVSGDDLKLLSDYITNLENRITNLQKEVIILQGRINKACDNIISIRLYGFRSGKCLIGGILSNLLDILNGSDKE